MAMGVLAVFIIFGVINAYATGMSRVFNLTVVDGGLPKAIAHRNGKTGSPSAAPALMLAGMIHVFIIYYSHNVDLNTAFLASGGAAIIIYIIGFAAAIRIVGKKESIVNIWMQIISLVTSLVILAFVGFPIVVSLLVIGLALVYITIKEAARPKSSSLREHE